jgi:hypothetical protein
MTQEEKQLLLIDLSARLPYGLFIKHPEDNYPVLLTAISKVGFESRVRVAFTLRNSYVMNSAPLIEVIKPYLRPMSSMTEVEKEIYKSLKEDIDEDYCEITQLPLIDWLNAEHFDYRGLIERGLALEAPEGMYKN